MSQGSSLQNDTKSSSAASAMMRKARSFRNDFKKKFPRGAGNFRTQDKTVGKTTALSRADSFSDGSKVDGEDSKKTEVVRLDEHCKKLLQALNYVTLICKRGLREQLAGSITVVVEIVMEVMQVLGNSMNQDSTVLASACGRLRQNLADLTRWSDLMLLDRIDGPIDLEIAESHVNGMKDAVQELFNLVSEKLKTRKKASTTQQPVSSAATKAASARDERCPLPDLPLTNRERQLLEETSHLAVTSGLSYSADDILDVEGPDDRGEISSAVPPPKPPLPLNVDFSKFKSVGMCMDRSMSVFDDRPPALPVKHRNMSLILHSSHSSSSLGRPPTVARSGLSYRVVGCSPSSSVGSNPASTASSLEDILSYSDSCPKTASVFMRHDSRLSNYDNTVETNSNRSSVSTNRSVEDECDVCLPPLPAKRGASTDLRSSLENGLELYDNVTSHMADVSMSSSIQHKATSEFYSSHCKLQFSSRSSSVTSATSGRSAKSIHFSARDSSVVCSSSDRMYAQVDALNCQSDVSLSPAMCSTKSLIFAAAESEFRQPTVSEGQLPSHGLAPPLPPKLKHNIDSYMKMFGQCSTPSFSGLIQRHSWQMDGAGAGLHNLSFGEQDFCNVQQMHSKFLLLHPLGGFSELTLPPNASSPVSLEPVQHLSDGADHVPELPPKTSLMDSKSDSSSCRTSFISSCSQSSDTPFVTALPVESYSPPKSNVLAAELHPPASCGGDNIELSESSFDSNVLENIDVTDQLVFRKPGEEGPEVRGGYVDALVVHATASGCGLLYQEAFLATYRTFLSPADLINKLLFRYNHFSKKADIQKKKIANNTFSLLIRVVDDLCTATDEHILQTLMDLVYQLVRDDELMLARTLRKKVLEKCVQHRLRLQYNEQVTLLSSFQLTSKSQSVMEFESKTIAEQMTLLDAELFQKIELPEVLFWSKEQSEEHSPNLTKFTEHFNKMSYWCRTHILEQEDARERERYFMKFIKIMKHLRRLNNFNSYLAVLSAVDSAPVRRLEWQKQNIEVLKEYCRLIDSSSSFRAYRQVLAKSEPPCIPYIGLVLQDMTFVHIGNPDKLPDGQLNFTKCYQLFTIMDNMRRFKNCNYEFKKNSKVIGFFNNFDNYISEESLWQISEAIKPRGSGRGSAQRKQL